MSKEDVYSYMVGFEERPTLGQEKVLNYINELEQENKQLKIKYATEVLKQKGITTCINWGGFQLNELDAAIQNLIDLTKD